MLLALLFAAGAQAAAPALPIDENFAQADLAGVIALYEDTSGQQDFAAVREQSFMAASQRGTNFGFSRSAWWVRVQLANQGDRDREVLLRQDYPLIDHLDVWTQDANGRWQVVRTGDLRPFSTRPIAHRDFVFPVRLAKGEVRTVYLRYQTSGALNIGLSLASPHQLIENISLEQLAYGAYFGGFGVLFFYNLFIFLTVRDRAFFYYLLYALSYGLYFGVHNGLSFQFLWPDSPIWGNQALLVLLAFSLIFGTMFARHFLNSMRHSPRLDRLALGVQWLSLAGLFASFFLPYSSLIQPMAYLTIVCVAVIVALGGVGLAQRYRPAGIFMLAWAALLASVLIYMVKTFGLLPHNAFTQNAFQAGALLEMVLLSLALAARVNELQRQTLTDALTSLSNRRYFDRQLELSFAHSREAGVALLILDIDHFKRINDRHGHAKGDEILVAMGQLLRAEAPAGSIVCRYGGEEFAIIVATSDGAHATSVAEAIRGAVQTRFANELEVTVSIGVASTARHSFSSEMEFFKAADDALYRAKQNGRNRVEVATA